MCQGMLHQPKPAEQELQPGGQIGEAPDMVADDAAAQVLGERGAAGQHELDMRLQRLSRRIGSSAPGERVARPRRPARA